MTVQTTQLVNRSATDRFRMVDLSCALQPIVDCHVHRQPLVTAVGLYQFGVSLDVDVPCPGASRR